MASTETIALDPPNLAYRMGRELTADDLARRIQSSLAQLAKTSQPAGLFIRRHKPKTTRSMMNETTTAKPLPDSRTLIPNGPLIKELRKIRGWSQQECAHRTHDTVERIARTEDPSGRCARRYKFKTDDGELTGFCIGTIRSIENSKPAYPFTMKIIAETFDLPLQSLILPGDTPSPCPTSSISTDRSSGTVEQQI